MMSDLFLIQNLLKGVVKWPPKHFGYLDTRQGESPIKSNILSIWVMGLNRAALSLFITI